MASGAVDDSNVRVESQYSSTGDLGEVVRRLMGWSPWDGRGTVLWADGFENGLGAWVTLNSGTEASTSLDTSKTRHGRYSVKMVGGSTSAFQAGLQRDLPYPFLSKHGLEAHIGADGIFDEFGIQASVFDGTNVSNYGFRYDRASQELRILTPGSVWTTIATGIKLNELRQFFAAMKFVFDPITSLYTRALWNNNEYDISTYGPNVAAHTTNPALEISVVLFSRSGNNDDAWVDDVIITNNE